MKKITQFEERWQLKNEGVFLEGTFVAQYEKEKTKNLVSLIISGLIIAIVLVCRDTINLPLLAVIFALSCFRGYQCFTKLIFPIYVKKVIQTLLYMDVIYVNWVTIVKVDAGNCVISYIEDGALGSDNQPYIVDYIATPKDCGLVVKGERVFILYVFTNEGKQIPLLVKTTENLHILEETKIHAPIHVSGLCHVPYTQKFSIEKERRTNSKKKKELVTLGIVTLLASILFGAILYVGLEEERYIKKNAMNMEGVVVEAGEFREQKSRGIHYEQTYTISYKWNGRKYSYTFRNVQVQSRVRVGDKVEILVLPEDPGKAYRASSYEMGWIWWVVGVYVLYIFLFYRVSKKYF